MSPSKSRRFVAYYRVSTDRQGASGLGLDAQRKAVLDYLNGGACDLIAEHTEIESGKRADRPELQKALDVCRRQRATLVIAKLDRLSRNVAFVATIMDSGISFVACDNPHANELTIHILAAVAQHERKMISERTRAALEIAKGRIAKTGQRNHPNVKRLGNPTPREAAERATAAAQAAADRFAANVLPIIRELQASGHASANAIAAELNNRKVNTARGGRWSHVQVAAVIARTG